MPQFTFTGDPRAPGTDPLTCEIGGKTFTFLVSQEVDDVVLAEKLRRHSHFTETAGEPTVGYRAVHKGRGKFAIVFGDKDEQVQSDLSKEDARAFNSMTPEEQAAYLGVK